MRNNLIAGLAAASALFVTAPVWAGGGHGHGHWKHGHGHQHAHVDHYHQRHVVVRERWVPAPVYARPVYAAPVYAAPVYAAPAPGVHISLPSVFIPFR